MLDQERLQTLIRGSENSFVEFEDEAVDNKKLAREIVALLNHRGGYLLLGVSDAGEILGLTRSDNEERIMNVCADLITPVVQVTYYEILCGEKRVAVIEVEAGHNKPYAVQENANLDGRKAKIKLYYNRYGSTTREVTDRDELQRLFQASGKLHFETTPVAGAKLSDLDFTALSEYLQNYRRLEVSAFDEAALHRLLENLNLLTRTDAEIRPSLAGLLMFGKNRVARWLPQNGLDCVKTHGHALEEGTDNVKFFERNVFLNLEDALAFIYRYNTQSFVVEGMRRIDFWDYPEKALRECLVNAIVHRDYTISGSHIRVHIFADRLEVRSPGRLPNSLTLEKIQVGTIYHRNPVLMQFFYDAHLSERLGQGIPTIIREMKANGNPEPRFEDLGDEIKVTLYKRTVSN